MSTVTVTATLEADNTPPRVRLDVVDTGTPAITATTVTRQDPNGTAVPVRTTDGMPLTLTTSGSNRVGLLYDYEAPFAPVTYSTVESPTVVSASVTVPSDRVWLIHPGVPALSMPVTVVSIGARSRKVRQGVHYPMGRATPIVVTDGSRSASEYTLTVRTNTDAERTSLDALLGDSSALLLNVPAGKQWGVMSEYVSVGDSSEERLFQYGREPRRTWSLPCTVVDRPVGGTQAQRTLLDLLDYPTLDSLKAAYPTLNDVLAGP